MVVVTVLTNTKKIPQPIKATNIGANHQNFDFDRDVKSSKIVPKPEATD
jgi:hypothetical protein